MMRADAARATPFIWIGANAITLYLVASVVSFTGLSRRFLGGNVARFLNTSVRSGLGDLVVAFGAILLVVIFARFLYRRKIFLRL